MTRPICVHCGKAYGQRATRTETYKYAAGEPRPAYRGNGIVTKERDWNTLGSTGSLGSIKFSASEIVGSRTIWDGETWRGGYDPFCTLRCALDYARQAWVQGVGARSPRRG